MVAERYSLESHGGSVLLVRFAESEVMRWSAIENEVGAERGR